MENNAHQPSTDDAADTEIITVTHYNVSSIIGGVGMILGILSFAPQHMGIIPGNPYMAILGVFLGGFTLLIASPIKTVRHLEVREPSFDDIDSS